MRSTEVTLDRPILRRPTLTLAVPRDALQFAHWPSDGFHLVHLPAHL